MARDTRGAAHPPHPAQRPAHGRGDGPRRRAARRRCASRPRPSARLGARRRHRRARAGAAAAARQARRLRLVARAHAAGAARSGRGRARSPRAQPAGTRSLAEQRALPRRLLGARATSSSRATPSCSRRCASRCSRCSRPARAPRGARIPAKGLTGTGYDGHSFWDTDLYVVPVLTYTAPAAAADALRWRHSTLPAAKARARDLGLAGAAFPWRTIHGEECSGYWPAGTAAFHVNADIADVGASGTCSATGDERVRARRRHRDPRRDGAAVALARPLRPRRQLSHRRRHRPRRVQRHRRQQRLHEPDGAAEPASAPPTPAQRHPGQGARARRHARGDGRLARRRRARGHPVRREARRPPAVGGLHRARAVGLRRDAAGPVSAAAALPLLRSLSQAGGQAARPGARDAALSATRSRPSSGRATSTTTSASPCATRRCRRAPRRWRRPTPATCGWRSTTPPRRRSWICTTSSTTRATGCTWRRWPAPGSRSSCGFGGMRDHGERLRVRAAAARRADAAGVLDRCIAAAACTST